MGKISELSDELLIKILSYVPTKVAVSTSILSKQWEFLWMWLPKLEYNDNDCSMSCRSNYRDFIHKKLPLHRGPVIESLSLNFYSAPFRPEDISQWVRISVSHCVRELSITYFPIQPSSRTLLPCSLYTCKSVVTLKLSGMQILVDVPRTVCLPSLKTLHLQHVTYVKEDSLRLLLSYCPVLEDLVIERLEEDNAEALVVIVPSLQRLTLKTYCNCPSDGYVIVTPSLKYFKVEDERERGDYLISHMPELEEAYIDVMEDLEKLIESVTSVKRLSLRLLFNSRDTSPYRTGIVFNQLEQLNFCIDNDYWSKLLVRLLKDSPKLRVLNLYYSDGCPYEEEYESDNKQSSVPTCLLKSLETFKFSGYTGRQEERDFLSFLFKNARCLKSSSIYNSKEFN